jgi:ubiquinone/menaquinone biosynthesis C-methylase UbiE
VSVPVSWEIFDRAAACYEDWYTDLAGQRADQAERNLLEWLLAMFGGARSVVEIGCGTGHFTAWLRGKCARKSAIFMSCGDSAPS